MKALIIVGAVVVAIVIALGIDAILKFVAKQGENRK